MPGVLHPTPGSLSMRRFVAARVSPGVRRLPGRFVRGAGRASKALQSTFAMCCAIILCCGAAEARSECRRLHFGGEVRSGATYRQLLGGGLAFRMEPQTDDGGWTFEIGPVNPEQNEFDSFIYALNPPWRGRNLTHLSTEYGTPAQDAVPRGDRGFWFLARRGDGVAASQALDAILWPRTDTDQEEALSRLGALSMGHGVLRIIDSDFDRGTAAYASGAPPSEFGAIHRIVFSVDLTVPPGFTSAEKLRVTRAACPDTRSWDPRTIFRGRAH